MNSYIFIAFVVVGASLLATGLIILSAMLSSRASAQLAAKHPELHEEDWPPQHPAAPGETAARERTNIRQVIVH